jgi:putative hemolysin
MIYLYLLACLFFVILQGFFAASEISFISSSTWKLRHRQDKGDKNAKKVYELILKPEKFLATTLVGTNLAVVLSSSLLTFVLIRLGVKGSSLWITFGFTPFVVVFAELIPKNIGRFFKEDFSCRAVGVISFFEKLFLPVVKGIEAISKYLIKVFIKKARHRSPFVTKEEIRLLVKEIEREGGIDRGEKEAIEEVFEFRSDTIKDFCVGVKKIVAFDYSDPYQTILDTVKKVRFTRYPVFKNKEIIGYINVYDLFYNPETNWQVFIRPITKVGFNQKLQGVFTKLKSKKESLALVVKGKRPYGIITIQDIIREIITSIVKV